MACGRRGHEGDHHTPRRLALAREREGCGDRGEGRLLEMVIMQRVETDEVLILETWKQRFSSISRYLPHSPASLKVRDGASMRSVVPHTARHYSRAVIMPNLTPPVTTVEAVRLRGWGGGGWESEVTELLTSSPRVPSYLHVPLFCFSPLLAFDLSCCRAPLLSSSASSCIRPFPIGSASSMLYPRGAPPSPPS